MFCRFHAHVCLIMLTRPPKKKIKPIGVIYTYFKYLRMDPTKLRPNQELKSVCVCVCVMPKRINKKYNFCRVHFDHTNATNDESGDKNDYRLMDGSFFQVSL